MDAITIIALVVAAVAVAVAGLAVVALVRQRAGGADDGLAASIAEVRAALDRRAALEDERVGRIDAGIDQLRQTVAAQDGALDAQLRRMAGDLAEVTGLFRHDGARGSWGEVSLERLFETAGMTAGRDFTMQFNAGDGVPDAVVHLPKGRTIVIDAKFPQVRFTEALGLDDDAERAARLADHAKEVARTGKALAKKGYADHATAQYVVMFVPSQAVFEAAMAAHAGLFDELFAVGVVITGPAGLFSLLKSAAALLAQQAAVDDAKAILAEVSELRKRLAVFVDHLDGIRSGLARAVEGFNRAIGSWNGRLVPHVDAMVDLAHLDDVDHPEPVTEDLRLDEVRDPRAA